MPVRRASWKKELKDLVATARNEKEREALRAFARAVGPYLEHPDKLRTLLSKIQASTPQGDVGIVVAQGEFETLNDVRKALPEDVKLVKL